MAVELLSPAHDTLHEPHHDLESFYWVLVWVVLRHTDCTLQEFKLSGQLGCKRLFNALDNYARLDCKRSWISQAFNPSHGLDVARNAPLTELLKRFKSLIARVILYIDTPQSFTHQAVLAVFDEALAMDGWPQNDWNPCTLLDMDPCPGFTPLLADIPRDFPEAVLPRSRQAAATATVLPVNDYPANGPTHPPVPPPPSSPRQNFGSVESESTEPQQGGRITRSESKRSYTGVDRPSTIEGVPLPQKRSKTTTMALPIVPAAAESSFGTQLAEGPAAIVPPSRMRRGGSRPTPQVTQPVRQSSRIMEKAEKKASTSGAPK